MSVTVEDLKRQYSMSDVVARYGLKANGAGFINCPFHQGDRTPSLKLYKDNFHCYGCGANGDIFTFVMLMDNCDFKTAFHQLGGEYSGKGLSDAAVMRIKKTQLEKQKREKRIQKAQGRYRSALNALREAEQTIVTTEPMSDAWCAAQNDVVTLRAEADEALAALLDLQQQEKR